MERRLDDDRPMNEHMASVGTLLRDWRQRRRMSQLDLALEAEISARHLSFLETGRSRPSRDMVTRLASQLDVPLRERNALLLAAGYAPVFPERSLDDPDLDAVRRTVDLILTGHEPVPALAIDRDWTLIAANRTARLLMSGVAPSLLEPPVNVVRLSAHPDGLASQILNYTEWRDHLTERLRRDQEISGSLTLLDLIDELHAWPVPGSSRSPDSTYPDISRDVAVPLLLRVGDDVLSFYSTTTVFGTPIDVTVSELAIESFFPADTVTYQALTLLMSARA